jgi:hypothetical protein
MSDDQFPIFVPGPPYCPPPASTTYHISAAPGRYNPNLYQVERHTSRPGWSPLVEHIADARDFQAAQAIVAAFEAQ